MRADELAFALSCLLELGLPEGRVRELAAELWGPGRPRALRGAGGDARREAERGGPLEAALALYRRGLGFAREGGRLYRSALDSPAFYRAQLSLPARHKTNRGPALDPAALFRRSALVQGHQASPGGFTSLSYVCLDVLFSASDDGAVKLWYVSGPVILLIGYLPVPRAHSLTLSDICIVEDMLAVSWEDFVSVWDVSALISLLGEPGGRPPEPPPRGRPPGGVSPPPPANSYSHRRLGIEAAKRLMLRPLVLPARSCQNLTRYARLADVEGGPVRFEPDLVEKLVRCGNSLYAMSQTAIRRYDAARGEFSNLFAFTPRLSSGRGEITWLASCPEKGYMAWSWFFNEFSYVSFTHTPPADPARSAFPSGLNDPSGPERPERPYAWLDRHGIPIVKGSARGEAILNIPMLLPPTEGVSKDLPVFPSCVTFSDDGELMAVGFNNLSAVIVYRIADVLAWASEAESEAEAGEKTEDEAGKESESASNSKTRSGEASATPAAASTSKASAASPVSPKQTVKLPTSYRFHCALGVKYYTLSFLNVAVPALTEAERSIWKTSNLVLTADSRFLAAQVQVQGKKYYKAYVMFFDLLSLAGGEYGVCSPCGRAILGDIGSGVSISSLRLFPFQGCMGAPRVPGLSGSSSPELPGSSQCGLAVYGQPGQGSVCYTSNVWVVTDSVIPDSVVSVPLVPVSEVPGGAGSERAGEYREGRGFPQTGAAEPSDAAEGAEGMRGADMTMFSSPVGSPLAPIPAPAPATPATPAVPPPPPAATPHFLGPADMLIHFLSEDGSTLLHTLQFPGHASASSGMTYSEIAVSPDLSAVAVTNEAGQILVVSSDFVQRFDGTEPVSPQEQFFLFEQPALAAARYGRSYDPGAKKNQPLSEKERKAILRDFPVVSLPVPLGRSAGSADSGDAEGLAPTKGESPGVKEGVRSLAPLPQSSALPSSLDQYLAYREQYERDPGLVPTPLFAGVTLEDMQEALEFGVTFSFQFRKDKGPRARKSVAPGSGGAAAGPSESTGGPEAETVQGMAAEGVAKPISAASGENLEREAGTAETKVYRCIGDNSAKIKTAFAYFSDVCALEIRGQPLSILKYLQALSMAKHSEGSAKNAFSADHFISCEMANPKLLRSNPDVLLAVDNLLQGYSPFTLVSTNSRIYDRLLLTKILFAPGKHGQIWWDLSAKSPVLEDPALYSLYPRRPGRVLSQVISSFSDCQQILFPSFFDLPAVLGPGQTKEAFSAGVLRPYVALHNQLIYCQPAREFLVNRASIPYMMLQKVSLTAGHADSVAVAYAADVMADYGWQPIVDQALDEEAYARAIKDYGDIFGQESGGIDQDILTQQLTQQLSIEGAASLYVATSGSDDSSSTTYSMEQSDPRGRGTSSSEGSLESSSSDSSDSSVGYSESEPSSALFTGSREAADASEQSSRSGAGRNASGETGSGSSRRSHVEPATKRLPGKGRGRDFSSSGGSDDSEDSRDSAEGKASDALITVDEGGDDGGIGKDAGAKTGISSRGGQGSAIHDLKASQGPGRDQSRGGSRVSRTKADTRKGSSAAHRRKVSRSSREDSVSDWANGGYRHGGGATGGESDDSDDSDNSDTEKSSGDVEISSEASSNATFSVSSDSSSSDDSSSSARDHAGPRSSREVQRPAGFPGRAEAKAPKFTSRRDRFGRFTQLSGSVSPPQLPDQGRPGAGARASADTAARSPAEASAAPVSSQSSYNRSSSLILQLQAKTMLCLMEQVCAMNALYANDFQMVSPRQWNQLGASSTLYRAGDIVLLSARLVRSAVVFMSVLTPCLRRCMVKAPLPALGVEENDLPGDFREIPGNDRFVSSLRYLGAFQKDRVPMETSGQVFLGIITSVRPSLVPIDQKFRDSSRSVYMARPGKLYIHTVDVQPIDFSSLTHFASRDARFFSLPQHGAASPLDDPTLFGDWIISSEAIPLQEPVTLPVLPLARSVDLSTYGLEGLRVLHAYSGLVQVRQLFSSWQQWARWHITENGKSEWGRSLTGGGFGPAGAAKAAKPAKTAKSVQSSRSRMDPKLAVSYPLRVGMPEADFGPGFTESVGQERIDALVEGVNEYIDRLQERLWRIRVETDAQLGGWNTEALESEGVQAFRPVDGLASGKPEGAVRSGERILGDISRAPTAEEEYSRFLALLGAVVPPKMLAAALQVSEMRMSVQEAAGILRSPGTVSGQGAFASPDRRECHANSSGGADSYPLYSLLPAVDRAYPTDKQLYSHFCSKVAKDAKKTPLPDREAQAPSSVPGYRTDVWALDLPLYARTVDFSTDVGSKWAGERGDARVTTDLQPILDHFPCSDFFTREVSVALARLCSSGVLPVLKLPPKTSELFALLSLLSDHEQPVLLHLDDELTPDLTKIVGHKPPRLSPLLSAIRRSYYDQHCAQDCSPEAFAPMYSLLLKETFKISVEAALSGEVIISEAMRQFVERGHWVREELGLRWDAYLANPAVLREVYAAYFLHGQFAGHSMVVEVLSALARIRKHMEVRMANEMLREASYAFIQPREVYDIVAPGVPMASHMVEHLAGFFSLLETVCSQQEVATDLDSLLSMQFPKQDNTSLTQAVEVYKNERKSRSAARNKAAFVPPVWEFVPVWKSLPYTRLESYDDALLWYELSPVPFDAGACCIPSDEGVEFGEGLASGSETDLEASPGSGAKGGARGDPEAGSSASHRFSREELAARIPKLCSPARCFSSTLASRVFLGSLFARAIAGVVSAARKSAVPAAPRKRHSVERGHAARVNNDLLRSEEGRGEQEGQEHHSVFTFESLSRFLTGMVIFPDNNPRRTGKTAVRAYPLVINTMMHKIASGMYDGMLGLLDDAFTLKRNAQLVVPKSCWHARLDGMIDEAMRRVFLILAAAALPAPPEKIPPKGGDPAQRSSWAELLGAQADISPIWYPWSLSREGGNSWRAWELLGPGLHAEAAGKLEARPQQLEGPEPAGQSERPEKPEQPEKPAPRFPPAMNSFHMLFGWTDEKGNEAGTAAAPGGPNTGADKDEREGGDERGRGDEQNRQDSENNGNEEAEEEEEDTGHSPSISSFEPSAEEESQSS